jgi:hypothetical protein
MNQSMFQVNAVDYARVQKVVCGKKATVRGAMGGHAMLGGIRGWMVR